MDVAANYDVIYPSLLTPFVSPSSVIAAPRQIQSQEWQDPRAVPALDHYEGLITRTPLAIKLIKFALFVALHGNCAMLNAVIGPLQILEAVFAFTPVKETTKVQI